MDHLTADLVLRGGRIWTGADDGRHPEVSSLAIRDGTVVAAGSDDDLRGLAEGARTVVDLAGRRVLPGLIDSHIHAVRAGLTWERELHWEDVRSLEEGLEQIRARAARVDTDTWVCVVGGWHARQLREGRPPTRAELDAVAPDHCVYVQMLYDEAVLNSKALRACGWDAASADPPGGSLERDAATGEPTGVIRGFAAFRTPLALALRTAPEERGRSTLQMLDEFASHGLTAVVDGGGLLMTPESYRPVYELWQAGRLPMRLRLFVSATGAGSEVADATAWTRYSYPGFGDDRLRVTGLGEVVHLGCHDFEGLSPFEISDPAWAELVEISRIAVANNWPMSVHAVLDSTVGRVLDAWESIAADYGGLAGRRFTIVHADEASAANLDRIAALGVGVLVQDRMILKATDYLDAWGDEPTRNAPPIGDMMQRGIKIAAGSDATRANWFGPWPSIWWLVTGQSIDSGPRRHARHRMTMEQALVAYTRAGAWVTGEEHRIGQLRPGFVADLCIPSVDPFGCDVDEVRDIRSELTLVAGRVTHHSGAFADLPGELT